MVETKMIKGYCEKRKRHFGLELKKFGTDWRVVNFIDITPEEASVMTTDVRQSTFSTNSNLLPCLRCGSRKVGGCNCPELHCPKSGNYEFQCVYCKHMKIDYSEAMASGNYREGDVIKLSQGQEVKISFNGKPLNRILVGIGWDPVSSQASANMDVDSSVFVLNGNGEGEIVYFGNLEHPSGCVVHHGDNLTGVGSAQEDDENIDAFLDKVPRNRDRLVFVVNIYKCEERNQTLGKVKNMYISLKDPINRKKLVEYRVNQNMDRDTAIVIGMAYRLGSGWMFKALGRGSRAKRIGELFEECKRL